MANEQRCRGTGSIFKLRSLLALPCLVSARPRFHAITVTDVFDLQLMLPFITASRHGWQPRIIGLGIETGWGPLRGNQLLAIRDYIVNKTEPEDVVLVFDAFDVMFLGSDREIVDRYLEMEAAAGRELIFNADPLCSAGVRCNDYDHSDSPWKYVNSGVVIGRSRALRRLYDSARIENGVIKDKSGRPLRHQNHHTDFYLDNRNLCMLDEDCRLMQVVWTIENVHVNAEYPWMGESPGGRYLTAVDGKLLNRLTKTAPLILHFAGPGHWADLHNPERIGTCCAYETLRALGHPDQARKMEAMYRLREDFTLPPWKVVCDFVGHPFDSTALYLWRAGYLLLQVRNQLAVASSGVLAAAAGAFVICVLAISHRRGAWYGRVRGLRWVTLSLLWARKLLRLPRPKHDATLG